MIPCVYIGDSIAVGLHQFEPKCELHAKVGAGSSFITRNFTVMGNFEHAVISMGSNDPDNPALLKNAETLRRALHVKTAIWILPYNRVAARQIEIVAREFGDHVLDLKPIASKDGLHPVYEQAHKQLQNVLK